MRRSSEMGPVLRRAVAAAATLAFVAVACGGCSSAPPKAGDKGTKPADKPIVVKAPVAPAFCAADLPVPLGFVYDRTQSRVSDGGCRNLKLVYKRESYSDLDEATTLYKNALSAKGWDLQFQFGFERRGLIFWKGFEELRITLDSPWRTSYTTATLEVEPKDPTDSSPTEVQATVAKRVD